MRTVFVRIKKTVIKLSKLTDYAVVLLAEMAGQQGAVLSASGLADKTGVPEPTVSKILKILAKADLIDSVRGPTGGYRLDRTAQDLPINEIISAIEGPILLTDCAEGNHEQCAIAGTCGVNGRWTPVNAALTQALSKITLADMVK